MPLVYLLFTVHNFSYMYKRYHIFTGDLGGHFRNTGRHHVGYIHVNMYVRSGAPLPRRPTSSKPVPALPPTRVSPRFTFFMHFHQLSPPSLLLVHVPRKQTERACIHDATWIRVKFVISCAQAVGTASSAALRLIRMQRVAERSASKLRNATINGKFAGGHEAAVRRREKRSRRPDLRGIRHALKRIHRGEDLHALLA